MVIWVVAGMTAIAGLLMVSNFRYHSFKEFQMKDRVPFMTLLVILGVGIVILIDPASLLLITLLLYALSGPVVTFVGLKERRRVRKAKKDEEVGAEHPVASSENNTESMIPKQ
jgi:CDP-diacylglycerol--serine O-phosphatidyltransferase